MIRGLGRFQDRVRRTCRVSLLPVRPRVLLPGPAIQIRGEPLVSQPWIRDGQVSGGGSAGSTPDRALGSQPLAEAVCGIMAMIDITHPASDCSSD